MKLRYKHRMLASACLKLGISDYGMNRERVFDVICERTACQWTSNEPAQWQRIAAFCEWSDPPPKPRKASKVKAPKKARLLVMSRSFLSSAEWRRVRMLALVRYGNRCQCCGASPSDGVTVLNVDHVQPRATHPELALVVENLQILCAACNHGKGNWNATDWRLRR